MPRYQIAPVCEYCKREKILQIDPISGKSDFYCISLLVRNGKLDVCEGRLNNRTPKE